MQFKFDVILSNFFYRWKQFTIHLFQEWFERLRAVSCGILYVKKKVSSMEKIGLSNECFHKKMGFFWFLIQLDSKCFLHRNRNIWYVWVFGDGIEYGKKSKCTHSNQQHLCETWLDWKETICLFITCSLGYGIRNDRLCHGSSSSMLDVLSCIDYS